MKEKIIILDTETTGLESDAGMIQLGYIVCDLKFNELKRENMFFDTDKDIGIGAMAVHHITQKILVKKLAEDERTDEMKLEIALNDFEDAYLIAHNSTFDKRILDTNGVVTDPEAWIDSYCIAYELFQEEDMKHSLQYLRYYLNCEFDEVIDAHDALSDVIVLKSVFHTMLGEFLEKAMQQGADLSIEESLDCMVDETKKGIVLRIWAFGKHKGNTFANTIKFDRQYFVWMYNQKKQDKKTDDAVFNTLRYYLNQTRIGKTTESK